jgi:AAHS family benzoate transporter-like MFS transporter
LLILSTLKEPTIYSDIKDPEKNLRTQISLRENIKSQLKSPNRKSLLASLVISFILGLNVIFRNLVEQELSTSDYLTSSQVSIIMLVGVFAVIFAAIVMGTLADKIGRLPLLYIFSLLIPIGRILFVLFVNTPISFISSMIFIGLSEIGYWGGWVTISIVILELIPTESRGTGSGLKSFFGAMGITVGLLSASLITLFYGLPIAFIVIGLMSLINLPLIYKYLKETKQVDMKDVYGVK